MSGTLRIVRPDGLGARRRHAGPPRSQSFSEILHVRVTAEQLERLNAVALGRRVEVSTLVRELIDFGIPFAEVDR